jgi:hypothetical protein
MKKLQVDFRSPQHTRIRLIRFSLLNANLQSSAVLHYSRHNDTIIHIREIKRVQMSLDLIHNAVVQHDLISIGHNLAADNRLFRAEHMLYFEPVIDILENG